MKAFLSAFNAFFDNADDGDENEADDHSASPGDNGTADVLDDDVSSFLSMVGSLKE